MSVTAIVETGTYRGTTTAFLSRFGVPVYTVEVSQRFYLYARRRFRATSHVHIERLDSRTFLRRLADRADFPKERVFFYLDSHWYADLPLREELRIVSETWRESVVMIDDFRVPEDPGYGFDDYGPGAALALDYIAPELAGFRVFWPAAPSETDTGARRGCVVLASRGPVAARLAALPTLREDGG